MWQSAHGVVALASWSWRPAVHVTHAEAPAGAYLAAPQFVHTVSPAFDECLPAAHVEQLVAELESPSYCPAAQLVQVADRLSATLPAPHALQLVFWAWAARPAGQSAQAVPELESVSAVPATQAAQAVAATGAYFPVPHAEQLVAYLLPECRPATSTWRVKQSSAR